MASWHDAKKELPEDGKYVLACTLKTSTYQVTPYHIDIVSKGNWLIGGSVDYWCYLPDTLPNGERIK